MYSISSQMRTLQEALDHVALEHSSFENLPGALPVTHVTDGKNFELISRTSMLSARLCKKLDETLVYLFYGGVFYRGSSTPAAEATEYPVALLFKPAALSHVDRFYPFDTGALIDGKYGSHWSEHLMPFKERFLAGPPFRPKAPQTLVKVFFGTNKNYLKGSVNISPDIDLPDPAALLARFLQDNLALKGVDQRQYRIECQCTQSLPLKDLLWVGYPDVYTLAYGTLFDQLNLPDGSRYFYDTFRAGRPAEMAALLQQEALKFVRTTFPELAL